jgi:hypothetical protein
MIHVKCIHEICDFIYDVCMICEVPICFTLIFWDLQQNVVLFVLMSQNRQHVFSCIFEFHELTDIKWNLAFARHFFRNYKEMKFELPCSGRHNIVLSGFLIISHNEK